MKIFPVQMFISLCWLFKYDLSLEVMMNIVVNYSLQLSCNVLIPELR